MSSKYAAAHVNPQGPGDARPTALQIIQDEGLENKLQDKVFLVTGCSSGIGPETARALAATGATVFCTARDMDRGRTALSSILEPGRVELLHMDLSSLASVRSCAAEFLHKSAGRCNVLVCNAGVMAVQTLTRTEDGFELQFGTNHLGHFLLFNLLSDALSKSSTPEFNSRVVMVSSSGHRGGPPRLGDLNYEAKPEEYTPFGAYSNSKSANVWMANWIDRHLGEERKAAGKGGEIHANSLHPGGIWTSLQKHASPETWKMWRSLPDVEKHVRSAEQGAATTVWAAVGKECEGKGGKYLEDCGVADIVQGEGPGATGWAKHAFGETEGEERLWRDSLVLVGLEGKT